MNPTTTNTGDAPEPAATFDPAPHVPGEPIHVGDPAEPRDDADREPEPPVPTDKELVEQFMAHVIKLEGWGDAVITGDGDWWIVRTPASDEVYVTMAAIREMEAVGKLGDLAAAVIAQPRPDYRRGLPQGTVFPAATGAGNADVMKGVPRPLHPTGRATTYAGIPIVEVDNLSLERPAIRADSGLTDAEHVARFGSDAELPSDHPDRVINHQAYELGWNTAEAHQPRTPPLYVNDATTIAWLDGYDAQRAGAERPASPLERAMADAIPGSVLHLGPLSKSISTADKAVLAANLIGDLLKLLASDDVFASSRNYLTEARQVLPRVPTA